MTLPRETLECTDNHYDSSTISDFVNSRVPSSVEFNIPEVSMDFVIKELQDLNIKKTTGSDDISSFYLRHSVLAIAPQFGDLLNRSISLSVFPDTWKTAKVKPAFKGGTQSSLDNYKPLSMLCVAFKVLEKHTFIFQIIWINLT